MGKVDFYVLRFDGESEIVYDKALLGRSVETFKKETNADEVSISPGRGVVTIIAGGRDIFNYDILLKAIGNCGWDIGFVFSGGAKGVDSLGETWADEAGVGKKIFNADWKFWGNSAGMVRNSEMACRAKGLIAVWDGKSHGTKNMIEEAHRRGLKVHVELI